METSLLRSPAATSPQPAAARPARAQPAPAQSATAQPPAPGPAAVVFAAIFTIGLATTVYCCRTMGHGLPMPGGWTLSMMWLQMPGQSRLDAIAQFIVMWLAMVSVMNLPVMGPVFLHTRKRSLSLFYMVGGYYAVWLMAGIAVCLSGTAMADWALHSDRFSRLIPFFRSGIVIAAGILYARRQSSQRPHPRALRETSLILGCRQGLACCISCTAPMAAQLALGMTNPFVMTAITIAIAAKRRQPNMTARALGITAIFTGVIMIWTSGPRHPKPIDCGNTPPAHYTVFTASSTPSSPSPEQK